MTVFLNGQFVPEECASVSIFDRGFLYGDGLFETIRIWNGKPFRWMQHWERLDNGAGLLKIKLPFDSPSLLAAVRRLVQENEMPNSLLRLTLSRGIGLRGYSPKGADRPTLAMSLHPCPDLDEAQRGAFPIWKLITASQRLPKGEVLAQFKTCNKLPQILARAEADAAGADEALLLNTDGRVVEAASSNLFWIESDAVCTPPLTGGILAGVTRAVVVDLCRAFGLEVREGCLTPQELKRARGIFLTLSSWGIIEAGSLDGLPLPSSPLIPKLRHAYADLLQTETA